MKIFDVEIDPAEIEKLSRSYGDDVPTKVTIHLPKGRKLEFTAHGEASKRQLMAEFDALFGPPKKK